MNAVRFLLCLVRLLHNQKTPLMTGMVLGVTLGIAIVHAQNTGLTFSVVHREIIEERLASPPHRNKKRRERLTALFEEVGCTDLAQQKVRGSKTANVVCTLPAWFSPLREDSDP